MSALTDTIAPAIDALKPYEPGRPIELVAAELGLDPAEVVKLASNENALGASPKVRAAIARAASECHRYPDGGALRLRERIAEFHGVSPKQVIVGNGSNEILEFVAHCFAGPGKSTVYSAHAFAIYRLLTAMFGARGIEVPMRQGLVHDLEAMLAAVDSETAVVFLCNPNNPTGTMVAPDAVEHLIAAIPEDVLLVIDEAYAELALAPMPPSVRWATERPNVLVCRTFSKAYGLAGLRVGYGIGSAELVQALQKPRQPFNVNLIAQEAAIAALDDQPFVEDARALCRTARDTLENGLRKLGLAFVPSAANFMLVDTGNSRETASRLETAGVIVRPMDGYRLPHYIRVTYGQPHENARFLDALADLLPPNAPQELTPA